jgi:hypothetical protein
MQKLTLTIIAAVLGIGSITTGTIDHKLDRAITVDSLGACQGISYQNGRIFLYGDREVGMIREFKLDLYFLFYQNK